MSVVGIVGAGVTGGRVAALLGAGAAGEVLICDEQPAVARQVAAAVGGRATDRIEDLVDTDVVALCQPSAHLALVERLAGAGVAIVSASDDPADVIDLLGLARLDPGVPIVVGAAMAPGLSGLLARSLAEQLTEADEIHVAVSGTGGPACARRHHRALGSRALGWADGEWIERPGGSGRELCWFPEPMGAHDCYRAAHADPILLHLAFPEVERITVKVSATRRDRLTARLPMLRPPHVGGNIGAVRVELRGALAGGERWTVIAGAAGRTAGLAAAVIAAAVDGVLAGEIPDGVHGTGDAALDPAGLLGRAVAHGVTIQEFTGVARPTAW